MDLLAKLQEGIDEEEEANTRFTIFEDMVEGYLYLNKGNYQVNFISATGHDKQNIFEVSTEDASETFRTPQASEWVTLLNQIAGVEWLFRQYQEHTIKGSDKYQVGAAFAALYYFTICLLTNY